MLFVARLLTVLVVLTSSDVSFADQCVEIWAKGLDQAGSNKSQKTIFKANERAIICIRIAESKLVSVWDTPPSANPTKLFPNRFSTPNDKSTLATRVEANRTVCFGDEDTFPLYFDEQDGIGPGRLSIVATDRIEDQFAPEDFVVPGRQITRATLTAKEKTLQLSAACTSKMRSDFRYKVIR